MNPELENKSSYYGFDGKIYFYNVEKGKYELVIESGNETKVTDMQKYLDKNNKLLIKYKFSNKDENTFPILSAIKEAK